MIKAVQESVGLDITERIIATSNDSEIQALKKCILRKNSIFQFDRQVLEYSEWIFFRVTKLVTPT